MVKQQKSEDESFTKRILRLARNKKSNIAELERYIDSISPDEDPAFALEDVVRKRCPDPDWSRSDIVAQFNT